MSRLISSAARSLFTSNVPKGARVLVTGASGWFGRTAVDLLAGTDAQLYCTASTSRTIRVSNRDIDVRTWDAEDVTRFQPELVIDCAFLTRDRLSEDRMAEYITINRTLTSQMLSAAALPTVHTVITISSGAAVYPQDALTLPFDDNPYGYLKREAEQALLGQALDSGVHAVVARAWAVSGGHVQFPRTFAFSDMILQAEGGTGIEIKAPVEVWRRYTAVDELLAVAAATAARRSGIVESGGPLVEMAGLADAVRRVVDPGLEVSRPPMSHGPANRYHNDGLAWRMACAEFSFTPLGLDDQIRATREGLMAQR
ncbi:NAD-dependent epimerase/dehydratase family protein [Microbacterium trichothecenolyticum]|uniref:NAD-dependent epimerase/dehydratase family protein n=1 Tax=Microbacterium trichothecenolyticum TaxID=69370 RepID=UPI0035BE2A5A